MNRYIFLFLIAAFSLLLHAKCVAQKNIVYGAGITYTVGIPTFVPPGNSSRVAIDTVTSKWYEYATPGGWRWSGDRVQDISGCATPAYTPGKAQSSLVLNACTEAQNGHGPELYKYTGSAWLCLNCGGNYTAGDGIDITGSVITNTGDLSSTNELQTLSISNDTLSISDGNSVVLPGDNLEIANVKRFGAIGNGTDATIAFQSAIATGKPVYIPKGRYLITDTLFLQKDQSVFGVGDASVLQINGGGIVFFVNKSGISISNLRIVGKSGGGIFQTAIRIDDPAISTNSQLNRILNVSIDSILFHGVRLESSWVGYKGSIISGCKFTNCATGLYLNSRGEYNTITSNIFTANTTAISLTGGNNNISNCNVSGNTRGFTIVAGTNELHGIISGCQINHNTQYGISATGTTLEQRVLNCQMYYSDIEFSNSDNFKFIGCTFSTDTLRFQSGSDNNYFTECEFVAGIIKNITSSSVYFIDNTNKTGIGQYGEAPLSNGQYILNVASGVHSWQLNTGGTTYNAAQGLTKTAADVFHFGGSYIGASSISGTRKFNLNDTTLIFGDTSDSTLFQIRGGRNQVAIGNATQSNSTMFTIRPRSGANSFRLETSAGASCWLTKTDGKNAYSDFFFAPFMVATDQYSNAFPTAHSATSSALTFSAGTDGNAFYFTSPIGWGGISGNYALANFGNTVSPASSSATFSQVRIKPTYSASGTFSGEIIGLNYAPTVTSIANGKHYAAIFASGQIGVGTTTPNISALVDISSTTKGFLPPRMTDTQKSAITGITAGVEVYCTDCTATDGSTGVKQTYNGSTWKNHW